MSIDQKYEKFARKKKKSKVSNTARRKSDKLLFIFYLYAFVSRSFICLDQYFHPKRSCNPDPRRTKFTLIRSHSRLFAACLAFLRVSVSPWWILLFCVSCTNHPDSNTVVMIIDSSPANLDPRIGTDGSSERIDQLMFDSLVSKDEHFNLHPWVAERWEMPDPQTYVFHLRHGIHFHDGRPLSSRDVTWTLDSIRNRAITTLKTDAYKLVDKVEAPDDSTVL